MDPKTDHTDSMEQPKPADECKSLKTTTAAEDRPREKALTQGFQSLTNAELLATIIGTGVRGCSVVDLCQRIMTSTDNRLYNLVRLSMAEIRKFPGIGEVKAIQICSALELARRYQKEPFVDGFQICSSDDAYRYLRADMDCLDHEEMWMVLLNRAKRVKGRVRISSGGGSATVADVKQILRHALERQADGIVQAHNHPSNNPTPSRADDELTKRMAAGCQAIGIELVDHIIVCRQTHYSYVDHGKL